MKTLWVVATLAEIEPLLSKHFEKKGSNFYTRAHTDVLIAGVGIVQTIYNLTRFLEQRQYNQIINVGICGTFSNTIQNGAVVNVVADAFGDMGVEDRETSMHQLSFFEDEVIDEGYIKADLTFDDLPKVKAITVNLGSGNTLTIAQRMEYWQAEVESMEGAAVFYVAKQFGIPVGQLRAVSNFIEPRNTQNWKIQEAINNLNTYLEHGLNRL
jgi:futalosine hydrolase